MSYKKSERYVQIQLELKEIKVQREFRKPAMYFVWLAIVWVVNAIFFGGVVLLASKIFATPFSGMYVITGSFLSASVITVVGMLQLTVDRIQAHNLTLHDQILRLQELTLRFAVAPKDFDEASAIVPGIE